MDDVIEEWLNVLWWVADGAVVKLAKVVAEVGIRDDRCNFYHQRKITVGSAALVVEWSSEVTEKLDEGALVLVRDVFGDVVVKDKFPTGQIPFGECMEWCVVVVGVGHCDIIGVIG